MSVRYKWNAPTKLDVVAIRALPNAEDFCTVSGADGELTTGRCQHAGDDAALTLQADAALLGVQHVRAADWLVALSERGTLYALRGVVQSVDAHALLPAHKRGRKF